jgi:predicted DNA-binding transcriptional regulator YafY
MRADRLLSMLMLLQTRGRLSAHKLAEELGVAERTIYRDVTALCASGVPIYTERGTGGGIALIEEYRTSLTGLTKDQVRALFMLNIPAPLSELGLDQDLRDALLKLSAALPGSLQRDRELANQRIYIDPLEWTPSNESVPHLRTLLHAVWNEQCVLLRYHSILGTLSAPLEAEVQPYGLVSKAGAWYLVYWKNEDPKVIALSRVIDVEVGTGGFVRQSEFDLVDFWNTWCEETSQLRPTYPVIVKVSPKLISDLPRFFGRQASETLVRSTPPDSQGWRTMTLTFEYLEEARASLLGFGSGLEVLEPRALQQSLVDYARQIIKLYGEPE